MNDENMNMNESAAEVDTFDAGIAAIFDSDSGEPAAGTSTADSSSASEQETQQADTAEAASDSAQSPAASADRAGQQADAADTASDSGQSDGGAPADQQEQRTEQQSEPASADSPAADTPVYLDFSYGDTAGKITEDDANRIGALVGLTGAQLVQAVHDGAELQAHAALLDTLRDFAAVGNQSMDDLAKDLAAQLPEMEAARILSELTEKFPDSDSALLQMMARQQAEARIREARESRAASADRARQQAEEQRFDATVARWSEVGRLFPDIKSSDDVPKEVFQACEKGADPVMQMYAYRLKAAEDRAAELEKQLQIANQNTRNAQASTGSMTGSSAEKTHEQIMNEIFETF